MHILNCLRDLILNELGSPNQSENLLAVALSSIEALIYGNQKVSPTFVTSVYSRLKAYGPIVEAINTTMVQLHFPHSHLTINITMK